MAKWFRNLEHYYIPGYAIKDKTRNVNDQKYNKIDEGHGEQRSYLYAGQPMAVQASNKDYVVQSNVHKNQQKFFKKDLSSKWVIIFLISI